jgi:hypothetical protein
MQISPQFQIWHDEPTLRVGAEVTPYELMLIARAEAPLFWSLHGETRMIPASVITDLHMQVCAKAQLDSLGRSFALPLILPITWDQAICVTEAASAPGIRVKLG